jgi:uridine kinase
MKGDRIFVEEKHRRAALGLKGLILSDILGAGGRFIVTIAGESGSGKSEVAEAFSQLLGKEKIECVILQQDDYFVYPPMTNASMRRKNIDHVGTSEVRLEALDHDLAAIMAGAEEIVKPLVIFGDDRITQEVVQLRGVKVVIVEGTYTTSLRNAHRRVFIDRTYHDTRESRRRRAREEQDEFLERVLEIEHRIISEQRARADIIVDQHYGVRKNGDAGKEQG